MPTSHGKGRPKESSLPVAYEQLGGDDTSIVGRGIEKVKAKYKQSILFDNSKAI